VKVVLTKEPAGNLVRVQSGRNSFLPERGAIDIAQHSVDARQGEASDRQRVFENAGASLEFVEEDDTAIGFIPHSAADGGGRPIGQCRRQPSCLLVACGLWAGFFTAAGGFGDLDFEADGNCFGG